MDFADYPNFLRVFIGETSDYQRDRCLVIETNIDDMNPQDYDSVFEKLYAAQTILMTELPIIPIYHYSDIVMVKPYVKGWGRSVLGSIDFSAAYIDKE